MERYKPLKQLGDGTYGSVTKALDTQTGGLVAIKRMKKKYRNWNDCIRLREVKALLRLSHPNIVPLREVIRENDELSLVFDYMDGGNLYEWQMRRMNSRKPFAEFEIRNVMFQVLQGLAYMHGKSLFHRDIKPENILKSFGVVKIADFGLARDVTSRPPYTDYVSTRWYRAPEILLRAPVYGPPVDVWAAGCILAELLLMHPLFAGSSEVDQVHKICNVLGSPGPKLWPEGARLAAKLQLRMPQTSGTTLRRTVTMASEDALNLLENMLHWDPAKRPTAAQALTHRFFATPMVGSQLARRSTTLLTTGQSVPTLPRCGIIGTLDAEDFVTE